MTTEIHEMGEFSAPVGDYTSAEPPAVSPLASIAIATGGVEDDASGMTITNPTVSNQMEPKDVTIYAQSITPTAYDTGDSAIASFDVVFSVGCICPESGRSSTYQVVKRIGVDKMKLANDAKMTTPVSIVEAVKEPSVMDTFGISTARFKALAGLK